MSDLAHIGHVELLTPRPEDSLRFYRLGDDQVIQKERQ